MVWFEFICATLAVSALVLFLEYWFRVRPELQEEERGHER